MDIAFPTLDTKHGEAARKTGPVRKNVSPAPAPEKSAAAKSGDGEKEKKAAGEEEAPGCPEEKQFPAPRKSKITKFRMTGGPVEASRELSPEDGEKCYGYGLEVHECLEMEPDGGLPGRTRFRPWNRWASVMFLLAFILGIVHAGATVIYSSDLLTPDELLRAPCEISGEVRDPAGRPLANASVVVTDASKSTFTNNDGWFVIKGISPGNHRVEASAGGYNAVSVKVDLKPNLLKSLDFTLEPGGTDIRVDDMVSPDFTTVRDSYLWAAPLMLAFSVFALLAGLICLKRKTSRTGMLFGALSIPAFGFGVGAAFSLAGILLASLACKSKDLPPFKKLRLGMVYPVHAETIHDEVHEVEPETIGDGDAREHSRSRQHRAKRFRRLSPKGHLRCSVCVDEIELGGEYIRCVCRRTLHVRCLTAPECPECKHPFRRKDGDD